MHGENEVLLTARDEAVRVPLDVAAQCRTIKHALDSSSSSPADGLVVPLPLVEARVLQTVLSLGHGSAVEIDERLATQGSEIDMLEVFAAASYLESPHLLRAIQNHLTSQITMAFTSPDADINAARRALRDKLGVPDDLTLEEATAASTESPLTPVEGPPPSGDALGTGALGTSERSCRLCALPGGEDLLEELLATCKPGVLSAAKSLSVGWRRVARRVMLRTSWQLAFLGLRDVIELGAAPALILQRMEQADGATEARRRDVKTQRIPLHMAVVGAAECAILKGADAAEEQWGAVLDALIRLNPKSAEARDLEGYTPVHVGASESAPPSVLQRLLDAYPTAPWQKLWKVMVLPRIAGGVEQLAEGQDPEVTFEVKVTHHMGRLPLHCCAAGRATLECITFLLSVYPQAASDIDSGGRTPLHLACMGAAPSESIMALVDANPSAAAVVDCESKSPLEYALEHRPQEAGVLQRLAAITPKGQERMVMFFMERMNMNAPNVVQLAQTLSQSRRKLKQDMQADEVEQRADEGVSNECRAQ